MKTISFLKASLWTILLAVVLVAASLISRQILTNLSVDAHTTLIASGFIAAVLAFIVTVFLDKKETGLSISQVVSNLGLKLPQKPQVSISILAGLPILIGYLVIVFGLGKTPALETGAGFMAIKIFFSQGFAEEVVFRGFIFRHLRKGRSFLKASFLSAILFALIHLVAFAKGTTPEIIQGVIISITFAFILSFPLAALFEIGGGSILGAALWHTSIDSINWFKELGEPGAPMNTYLGAVFVSSVLVCILCWKLKQKRTEIFCGERVAQTNADHSNQ